MLGTGNSMETIDGVVITPLQQFSDYRGKIMKFALTCDSNEMYFSVVHPGIVKGWHRHKEMQLNYACIQGKILLVLIDTRINSPTHKNRMEIYLSPENYNLVKIPPLVLNAFKGLGTTDSIIANLASIPHDEEEIERYSIYDFEYNWWKQGE